MDEGAARRSPVMNDVFGGLTTAIVALPLALAFGVASGLGPLAGLYGSIFVGFFAAVFGGTPSQISGPTAPMTVTCAGIVAKYAAIGQQSLVFSVIMMAGVIQMVLGWLRLGSYIQLVPKPVTSGFMTGIGCIILSTQWPTLLGHAPAPSAMAAAQHAAEFIAHPNSQALLVGGVSLLCSVCTPVAVSRYVPGSLLGLVAGTLTAFYGRMDLPTLGAIPSGLPLPRLPSFPVELFPSMLVSAVVLAVLGAIDSLLTSLVADSLTSNYHDSDKELRGQGIGNTLSGLFGGVAGAGATVRTVVNVRAGGRTPLSGALHSLVLLAIVAGLGRYASLIPLATLGGLLLKSGWDVLDWPYIRRLPQLPNSSVGVMVLVLLLTVFVDLIVAVAVGCAVMSVLYVKDTAAVQLSHCSLLSSASDRSSAALRELSPQEAQLLSSSAGRVGFFMLEDSLAFAAANGLVRKVVPAFKQFDAVILDVTEVDPVDDTAALAIEEILAKGMSCGKRFIVCGASDRVVAMFDRLQMTGNMPIPPNISRQAALEAALA